MLRKELRRVSDAYAALIRDSRAQKGVWTSREAGLLAEIHKLKTQHATEARASKANSELAAAARSLRSQLDAANAAVETLKAKLDDAQRSEARARSDAKTASATVEGVTSERDALLDFIADSKAETAALRAERDALRGAAAGVEHAARQVTEARSLAESRASMVIDLQSHLAQLQASSEATVQRQARELNELRRACDASARDVGRLQLEVDRERRRAGRLEQTLSSYRQAEAALMAAAAAAQPASPLAAPGVWTGPSATYGLGPSMDQSGLLAALGGDDGGNGLGASPGGATPAISRLLASLKASLLAQAQRETAAQLQDTEASWQSRLAAAESETGAVRRSLDGVREERDRLQGLQDRVLAAEAEVRAAVASAKRVTDLCTGLAQQQPSSSQGSGASATGPALPTLSSTLPAVASLLARLAEEALTSDRHRRLAQAESEDLRQELGLLRVELQADASTRAVAVGDVRAALRDARAERDRLLGDIAARDASLEAARGELREAGERIARYKDRVLRARDIIAGEQGRTASARGERDAALAEANRLSGELAAAEQRVEDARAMNEQALEVVGERDALVAKLRIRLRTMLAAQGKGDTLGAGASIHAGVTATSATTTSSGAMPRSPSASALPRPDELRIGRTTTTAIGPPAHGHAMAAWADLLRDSSDEGLGDSSSGGWGELGSERPLAPAASTAAQPLAQPVAVTPAAQPAAPTKKQRKRLGGAAKPAAQPPQPASAGRLHATSGALHSPVHRPLQRHADGGSGEGLPPAAGAASSGDSSVDLSQQR